MQGQPLSAQHPHPAHLHGVRGCTLSAAAGVFTGPWHCASALKHKVFPALQISLPALVLHVSLLSLSFHRRRSSDFRCVSSSGFKTTV